MMSQSSAAVPAPTTNNNDAATPTQAETTSVPPAETSTTSEPEPTTSSIPSTSSTTSEPTTSSTSSSSTTTQPQPTTTSDTPTTSSTKEAPTSTTESEAHTTSHVVTSIVTRSATDGTTGPSTLTITSTDTSLPTLSTGDSAGSASATKGSSATASTTSTAASGSGGSGLSPSGTIAVAVVVPVVSVALIIIAALYFWRKWKGNKAAEEERRKEVEEYGFNPNNDPTLPPVMGGSAYEPKDDTSGYRGWGTTSAGRKASTNLSSSAGVGLAMSEAGSAPGYHHAATPSDGTIQYSEGQAAAETEPIGVLGAAPVAAANNRNADIHRGPSNASSAYSAANRSEVSDESHMSGAHNSGAFYDDNPYYNDMQPQYGAYGDGPYNGNQPVIRDVQARRNTRIESPAVFPRQGNAGIAQNF